MIISLIAAVDLSNGIARKGVIPWHLNADLENFKHLTMGHHLLMGRKTYQTLGKPLLGRRIIVLTRNENFCSPAISIAHSVNEAIMLAQRNAETELFVAGGGEVFAQTMELAHRIYLSRVFTSADCDVFFPPIDAGVWQTMETRFHPRDPKNDHAFEFLRLEKRNGVS